MEISIWGYALVFWEIIFTATFTINCLSQVFLTSKFFLKYLNNLTSSKCHKLPTFDTWVCCLCLYSFSLDKKTWSLSPEMYIYGIFLILKGVQMLSFTHLKILCICRLHLLNKIPTLPKQPYLYKKPILEDDTESSANFSHHFCYTPLRPSPQENVKNPPTNLLA